MRRLLRSSALPLQHASMACWATPHTVAGLLVAGGALIRLPRSRCMTASRVSGFSTRQASLSPLFIFMFSSGRPFLGGQGVSVAARNVAGVGDSAILEAG